MQRKLRRMLRLFKTQTEYFRGKFLNFSETEMEIYPRLRTKLWLVPLLTSWAWTRKVLTRSDCFDLPTLIFSILPPSSFSYKCATRKRITYVFDTHIVYAFCLHICCNYFASSDRQTWFGRWFLIFGQTQQSSYLIPDIVVAKSTFEMERIGLRGTFEGRGLCQAERGLLDKWRRELFLDPAASSICYFYSISREATVCNAFWDGRALRPP